MCIAHLHATSARGTCLTRSRCVFQHSDFLHTQVRRIVCNEDIDATLRSLADDHCSASHKFEGVTQLLPWLKYRPSLFLETKATLVLEDLRRLRSMKTNEAVMGFLKAYDEMQCQVENVTIGDDTAIRGTQMAAFLKSAIQFVTVAPNAQRHETWTNLLTAHDKGRHQLCGKRMGEEVCESRKTKMIKSHCLPRMTNVTISLDVSAQTGSPSASDAEPNVDAAECLLAFSDAAHANPANPRLSESELQAFCNSASINFISPSVSEIEVPCLAARTPVYVRFTVPDASAKITMEPELLCGDKPIEHGCTGVSMQKVSNLAADQVVVTFKVDKLSSMLDNSLFRLRFLCQCGRYKFSIMTTNEFKTVARVYKRHSSAE